jgi:iron-sulfur cluster repair protein YtfE (RIC family)
MSDSLRILKYEPDKIDDIFTYFAQSTFPGQFHQLFNELSQRLLSHFQLEAQMFSLILEKYPEISTIQAETTNQQLQLKERLAELAVLNPSSSAWSQEINQLRLELAQYFLEEESRLFPLMRKVLTDRELAEHGRALQLTHFKRLSIN